MAKVSGMVGFYKDEHKLVEACRKTRDAGYKKFDAVTPFPVHGLEQAIGIKRSWLPWVTFFAGSTGGSFALWFMWWTSAVNWPVVVGGKPLFPWPAFIPIMFECTVLFAALFTVGTLFVTCGLPKVNPPILDPDLTNDKFCLFIPDYDVGYDQQKAEQLLLSLGAENVRKVTGY